MLVSILIISLQLISFQSPNLPQRPKEPPVVDIKFEGNKIFPTDELAGFIRDCEMPPSEGTTNQLNRFEWCGVLLTNHIRRSGYLEAKVVPKVQRTDAGQVVSYAVDEGVRYQIGTITIEGNNILTQESIRSKLALASGDVADGEKISKWLFEDVKEAYGELGFITYAAELDPTYRRDEGLVDIAVTIDEGKAYFLKSIKFLGEPIVGLKVDGMFLIQPGSVFNRRLYRESLARLNATGVYAPIDPDLDTAMQFAGDKVSLSITLRLKKSQ